jgi:hypothetical protein
MTQDQIDAIIGGIDENGNISKEVLNSLGLSPE